MMKFGTIKCPCGKEFYFETVSDVVECVYCGENDVSNSRIGQRDDTDEVPS